MGAVRRKPTYCSDWRLTQYFSTQRTAPDTRTWRLTVTARHGSSAAKDFDAGSRDGFFEATQGAPNPEALHSALNVIEACAHFDAPQVDVYIRVAGNVDKLYLDLADDAWRAVEIDSEGWRVVAEPPVRFRRAAGMQSLPEPVRGGSVDMLRSFLNVSTDQDFVLIVSWIPRGPAEQGTLSGNCALGRTGVRQIIVLRDPPGVA